jgi:thiamine-phosphate pyrophosphorylase
MSRHLPRGAPPAPRVYLITDRRATAAAAGRERPLVDVVAAALRSLPRSAAHAVAVQLREKDLPGGPLHELARALRSVTGDAGVRLFVNDRIDVALAVGADGVHLGGGALAAAEAHALGPGLEIAVSTHAASEVIRAADDERVSFAVFGPVWSTPSKRALGEPQGLEALRRAVDAAPLPLLALGGVGGTVESVQQCRAAGAHGIACVRAVLAATDPAAALARILEALEII